MRPEIVALPQCSLRSASTRVEEGLPRRVAHEGRALEDVALDAPPRALREHRDLLRERRGEFVAPPRRAQFPQFALVRRQRGRAVALAQRREPRLVPEDAAVDDDLHEPVRRGVPGVAFSLDARRRGA